VSGQFVGLSIEFQLTSQKLSRPIVVRTVVSVIIPIRRRRGFSDRDCGRLDETVG
jgi:hypothetical protein